MSSVKNIPVIYAFARSGGTLVNRCLGCISGNSILSEINPHASVLPIELQARSWLNLLNDEEIPEFSEKSYGEKIGKLASLAQSRGQILIIRDWSTVNFVNHLGEGVFPSFVLEQDLYLRYYGFTPQPVVITRRGADVYESLLRTFKHLRDLNVQEFSHCYLAYAKAVASYPIVHYEDICSNPVEFICHISNIISVNYDEAFLVNFSQFDKCTGDNTTVSKQSRGMHLKAITQLASYEGSPAYMMANLDDTIKEADRLLGYH